MGINVKTLNGLLSYCFLSGCLGTGLNWAVWAVGKTNRTPWVGWTLRLWASDLHMHLLGLLILLVKFWKSCCGVVFVLFCADCIFEYYALFAVCFCMVWLNYRTLLWLSPNFFLLQSINLYPKKWHPRFMEPTMARQLLDIIPLYISTILCFIYGNGYGQKWSCEKSFGGFGGFLDGMPPHWTQIWGAECKGSQLVQKAHRILYWIWICLFVLFCPSHSSHLTTVSDWLKHIHLYHASFVWMNWPKKCKMEKASVILTIYTAPFQG